MTRDAGVRFALERLSEYFEKRSGARVMLEYTDNLTWVRDELAPRVRELIPDVEILIHPTSLTSGVHMGPGTWAVAMIQT